MPDLVPNAAELIRQAYILAQVWDPGEEQPGVEANQGLLCLNRLIKEWSSKGTMIPAYKTRTISLTNNGVFKFELTPPITDVLEANITEGSAIKNALYECNLQEFNRLNFTDIAGRPDRFYIESDQDEVQTTTNIYFWPPPAGTYTATLYYKEFIDQFTYSDLITTLPLNYFDALTYALARKLQHVYGTVLSADFYPETDRLLATLRGVNRKDLSVQAVNQFAEVRRLRAYNIYSN